MKLRQGSRVYWGGGRCGEAAAGSTHGAQEVSSRKQRGDGVAEISMQCQGAKKIYCMAIAEDRRNDISISYPDLCLSLPTSRKPEFLFGEKTRAGVGPFLVAWLDFVVQSHWQR